MGFTDPKLRRKYERERAAEEAEERAVEKRRRLELADKLVMVLTDRIVTELIRPGPKPEERECYDMAQELRDMGPDLKDLVNDVLAVEKRKNEESEE